MRFGVLGTVLADVDGEQRLEGPRQRCVLALLMLEAGQVVPTARIAEALWADRPPEAARNSIQAAISRLRRLLAAEADVAVQTRGDGYLLAIDPLRIDLHRFRDLVRQAHTAEPAEADVLFREALGLWRGAPLADVESELLHQRVVPGLRREQLAARLDHHDVALGLGRAAALVPALTALVAEHPYEQRLTGQLMRALHASGRPDEALAAYQVLRDRLSGDLGLDPTGELRDLQGAVLRGERSSDTTAGAQAPLAHPAQLPPVPADFTGRSVQLDHLTARLAGTDGGALVVSAIGGQGGVGKTMLAVRAAHLLLHQFPDGQLYVDLRGIGPEPLDPARVLVSFLRALGVEGSAIPGGLDDRAALFRSRLAGSRVVVVLDNARDEAQVRPLLPGTAGCGVLVTSRSRLTGLAGADHVELDVFAPDTALDLLARIAGESRVAGEPDAAAEVVRLCGYLPLAVRIAGAKLAARPRLPVAALAARLADEHRRLDELVAGDVAVRSTLALSYDGLDPQAQQAFRLLATLDVPDFAAWVPAAILDVPFATAEYLLDTLTDAHLLDLARVDGTGTPRYRFHDLTKLYARERAARDSTIEETGTALRRAVSAWRTLAQTADDGLGYQLVERYPSSSEPIAVELEAADDPVGWFEAEAPAIVAVVQQAAAAGLAEPAWRLAQAAFGFLESRALEDDFATVITAALAACRTSGDRLGEAAMLRALPELSSVTLEAAREYAEQAWQIFTDLGEPRGVAESATIVGTALRWLGLDEEATTWLGRAMEAAQRSDPRLTAQPLIQLGMIHGARQDLDGAIIRFAEAVEVARPEGERWRRANANLLLGDTYRRQGRFDEAETAIRAAIADHTVVGHRQHLLTARVHLGRLYRSCRRFEQARAVLESVRTEAAELGYPAQEAMALQSLGRTCNEQGAHEHAVAYLAECAELARRWGNGVALTSALRDLGNAHRALGRLDAARNAWHECLELHRRANNRPEAAEITRLLRRSEGAIAQREVPPA